MLPKDVFTFLKSNLEWCFDDVFSLEKNEFIVTDDDRKYFQEEIGLLNADSAFIDFYSVIAIPVLGKGSELCTFEQIIEIADLHEHEEIHGMDRFLRISSTEGEGSYFYCKSTDAVYDISWGNEEDMAKGDLLPIYNSFAKFLSWYYSDE